MVYHYAFVGIICMSILLTLQVLDTGQAGVLIAHALMVESLVKL